MIVITLNGLQILVPKSFWIKIELFGFFNVIIFVIKLNYEFSVNLNLFFHIIYNIN